MIERDASWTSGFQAFIILEKKNQKANSIPCALPPLQSKYYFREHTRVVAQYDQRLNELAHRHNQFQQV
jgi:hypothetical protein